MLTSKQRAYLKSQVNNEKAIMQIGKNSVTPEVVKSVDECLEKRELIKISVLENCEDEPKVVAELVAGRTRSEVVMVIGKKIVLYREAKEPIIKLPKQKVIKE